MNFSTMSELTAPGIIVVLDIENNPRLATWKDEQFAVEDIRATHYYRSGEVHYEFLLRRLSDNKVLNYWSRMETIKPWFTAEA